MLKAVLSSHAHPEINVLHNASQHGAASVEIRGVSGAVRRAEEILTLHLHSFRRRLFVLFVLAVLVR